MFLIETLNQIKDKYLDSIWGKAKKQLEDIQEDFQFIPKPINLRDYDRYIDTLKQCVKQVENVCLTIDVDKIKEEYESQFDNLALEYMNREVTINDKYEDLINARSNSMNNEIRKRNEAVRRAFDESNEVYIKLEEKRKKLEEYNDDIMEMCQEHGITTADINLDNDSFSIDELNDLYDKYLSYMNKMNQRRKNIITLIREKIEDWRIQGTILAICMFIVFTGIFDFIAIGVISYIVYKQFKLKQDYSYWLVLVGIVYNIKPLAFVESKFDESQLQEEKTEENDEVINDLTDKWEAELKELEKENPEEMLSQMRMEFVNAYTGIMEEVKELEQTVEIRKQELIEMFESEIEHTRKEFEEEKGKIILLGSKISKEPIFDTRFVIGCENGVFEEVVDIGLRNIIIRPSADSYQMKMFLQVLLANALCNVSACSIGVIVYDPNCSGLELVPFHSEGVKTVLNFKRDKLTEIIERLRDTVSKNMLEMGGHDINEFNRRAIKTGRTPKEYELLIVLSQPKTVEEDEALSAFMSYSAKFGVFVWLVTEKTIDNTFVFERPFDKVRHPYVIDTETFGPSVSRLLGEEIKNLKSNALLWKDFIKVVVPEKKIWTYSTDEFIELDPGFVEGDPSEFKGYTVGNVGNIHALGVGGTGAGKSVFLNHLIATACSKYSPKELELWLCDFKGAEFSFYLGNEEYPSMLPHIKACLCTSDPDYAGSLFKALVDEAQRRYDMFPEFGVKNMYEYNKRMRREGKLDKILRRILFICDEFQVIFEKADGKVLESINESITYISKVARAAGIHFMFTSQSMNKTVSADVLQQFTLRFGLRCDEAVSMAIMGAKTSSSIKQQNGYLYVRSIEDKDFKSQKRYRTPFISEAVLHEHIEYLAKKAETENMPKHDVITYQESTVHSIEEIDDIFNKVKSLGKDIPRGTIFLGERMSYSSKNRAPKNIIMSTKNNTHIFSVFDDYTDYINFYKSVLRNIYLSTQNPMVIWNCQVEDLHYLCELDLDVPEGLLPLSDKSYGLTEMLKTCEGVYNRKVQEGDKDTPCFIFLMGWDKAVGFGIDKDPAFCAQLASLLQVCAEYNMHFIFISNDIGQIPNNVVSACKFKIAGKCSEKSSASVINTLQAFKSTSLPNGYMYLAQGSEIDRVKIYQSVLTREVESNEVVI